MTNWENWVGSMLLTLFVIFTMTINLCAITIYNDHERTELCCDNEGLCWGNAIDFICEIYLYSYNYYNDHERTQSICYHWSEFHETSQHWLIPSIVVHAVILFRFGSFKLSYVTLKCLPCPSVDICCEHYFLENICWNFMKLHSNDWFQA